MKNHSSVLSMLIVSYGIFNHGCFVCFVNSADAAAIIDSSSIGRIKDSDNFSPGRLNELHPEKDVSSRVSIVSSWLEGVNNDKVDVDVVIGVSHDEHIDENPSPSNVLKIINDEGKGHSKHVGHGDAIAQHTYQVRDDDNNYMRLQHYYHHSRVAVSQGKERNNNIASSAQSSSNTTFMTPFDQCNRFSQVDREEHADYEHECSNCTIQDDGTSIYACDDFGHCLFCNEDESICLSYRYDYVFDFDVGINDDDDEVEPIYFSYSVDRYQYVPMRETIPTSRVHGTDIAGAAWNSATLKFYNYYSGTEFKLEINGMPCISIERVQCPSDYDDSYFDFEINCTNLALLLQLLPGEDEETLVYKCGNGHDMFQFLSDSSFDRCKVWSNKRTYIHDSRL